VKAKLGTSATKRKMRVVATLTGAAACVGAMAPTATAQAAPQARETAHPSLKIVDLGNAAAAKKALKVRVPGYAPNFVATPDGSVPNLNFSLGMTFTGMSKFHVCGYHGTGQWRCTAEYTGFIKSHLYWVGNIGGNIESWRRGLTKVYWNNAGAGSWDQCNTNGSYNGFAGFYSPGGSPIFTRSYVTLSLVGPGHPTC
jgi:hypothetical protein